MRLLLPACRDMKVKRKEAVAYQLRKIRMVQRVQNVPPAAEPSCHTIEADREPPSTKCGIERPFERRIERLISSALIGLQNGGTLASAACSLQPAVRTRLQAAANSEDGGETKRETWLNQKPYWLAWQNELLQCFIVVSLCPQTNLYNSGLVGLTHEEKLKFPKVNDWS